MIHFNIEVPLGGRCSEPGSIIEMAKACEGAGFGAVGFTDHPAPSQKWLQTGGHPTYDPFAALAFVAAATTRIRLLTYLAVLPYRNPLLAAKSIATVDRLSSGRLILTVGTGYLRSEFAAVGRPFDRRNELFDEALEVITSVFEDGSFARQGSDHAANGQMIDPGPVQLPHPPIWVGGTSRRSRERAARWGQGWAPILSEEAFARVTRSAVLATVADVGHAIDDMRRMASAAGRDPLGLRVQLDGVVRAEEALRRPDDHHTLLRELQGVGVTDVLVRVPRDGPPDAVCDLLVAYGRTFGERGPAPLPGERGAR